MSEREAVGWREWVGLPALGIPRIKAKVDTGARTSALHAYDVERAKRGGVVYVRFKVHPFQRDADTEVEAEAPLIDERRVKSSGGHVTLRPVIATTVEILGRPHEIELTLVARDEMGFRMLLGRQALRGRYVVDAGRSYVGGRPLKRKKKKSAKPSRKKRSPR